MALTNAEKQARWRERNVVVLTESPEVIAEKLAAMDRDKLRLVVQLLPFAHPKPAKSERNMEPTPLQLGPELSKSDLKPEPPKPKGYITGMTVGPGWRGSGMTVSGRTRREGGQLLTEYFVVKVDGEDVVAGPFKTETAAYRWIDKNGGTQALAELPQKTVAQRKTAARRYRRSK
jgi:hypothetical protein